MAARYSQRMHYTAVHSGRLLVGGEFDFRADRVVCTVNIVYLSVSKQRHRFIFGLLGFCFPPALLLTLFHLRLNR